ncbi:MAG: choice-of-anchor Q domain-containing protein [Phycisphaerales bacterium]
MLRSTLVCVALAATPALADELLVPSEYATVQAAVDAAANGDTVRIGPGTYNEALNTLGKAITLASTDGPATTILDGTGLVDSILTITSGEGPDTVVTGLTFANGTGKQLLGPGTPWYTQGGAIFLDNSAPTITECVFDTNTALFGGAIMCQSNTAPTVTDCVFRNGFAGADNGGGGGAVYLVNDTSVGHFERCLFENNTGRQGGAIYVINNASRFIECDFVANTGLVLAGAAQIGANQNIPGPRPRFDRCRFLRNHAGDGSGFLGNGGAIEFFYRGAEMNDCLFAGNTAEGNGQHIAHLLGSDSDFTNCTIYGYNGGALPIITAQSDMRLVNCIIWDAAVGGTSLGSTVTVSQSIVRGGYTGTNNSSADPMFADPLGADGVLGTFDDDFTLLPGSPAIDAGDNTARPTGADLDLAGNPRLSDDPDTADTGIGAAPIVDLGAFEAQGPTAACFADCDSSGSLNIDDIDCFVAAFLSSDLGGADCDGNGSLNIDDIDCFVASFLAGCP